MGAAESSLDNLCNFERSTYSMETFEHTVAVEEINVRYS